MPWKRWIVQPIAAIKRAITTTPASGLWAAKKAKDQANRIKCQSNMRQIGIAMAADKIDLEIAQIEDLAITGRLDWEPNSANTISVRSLTLLGAVKTSRTVFFPQDRDALGSTAVLSFAIWQQTGGSRLTRWGLGGVWLVVAACLAVVYLALVWSLSAAIRLLESRLALPERS